MIRRLLSPAVELLNSSPQAAGRRGLHDHTPETLAALARVTRSVAQPKGPATPTRPELSALERTA